MKVPEPRRLPSGNWFIQLRLNGESIPITAATKAECKTIAELTKSKHRAGASAIKKAPKSITLSESFDKFLKTRKATLSPSTLRSYTSYAKNRFKNYQDKQLSKINWQTMINEELEHASEKTVQNAWGLVSSSLKHVGYPVPNVSIAPAPIKEIAFLQPEEIQPFCQAVRGKPYEIASLLMLHGLRLSEVKGLDWANVDLEKDVITVSGSMVRGVGGNILKSTNKNKTSSRPVPIMIPQLHNAMISVEDKSGLVVPTHGSNLLEDVKYACRKAGVTVVTCHGLRHSFASLCYYLNIPEKQICAWGGWANTDVLHRIYIRLAASMQTENQNTFSGFFQNQNANKPLMESHGASKQAGSQT